MSSYDEDRYGPLPTVEDILNEGLEPDMRPAFPRYEFADPGTFSADPPFDWARQAFHYMQDYSPDDPLWQISHQAPSPAPRFKYRDVTVNGIPIHSFAMKIIRPDDIAKITDLGS